jgi:hypothetical protein
VLEAVDFPADQIDTALGVGYVEGDGPGATKAYGFRAVYSDAVGDLSLISEKHGPSIGWFQRRSLREPLKWAVYDRYCFAWALTDPFYNAVAAKALYEARGWEMWSAYKSGSYVPHVGKDYQLVTGHPRADQWNA